MNHQSSFFVVGITHVDLAWKRGRDEMGEMLEVVVIRLLDALESDPDFRYHLEQAAHFRTLARRRPDLVERLRPYLQSGRLEFVGGMASTPEANLPNGECLVKNFQIGLRFVRETFGVPVRTGWFVDAFGIPAQLPQILRGFGIGQFMACRFGGNHTHDLFLDNGLDGSRVTVAGWGSYAAYIAPENVAERFCKNWDDIEMCFAKADTLTGAGPFLVIPYTENEMLLSMRPRQLVEERNRDRPHQHWRTATPAEYFDAVATTERTLPVVGGDLNPEFTGCFSLRHTIRLANRRVETRLLEAQKWAALTGTDANAVLESAWWELAYVQFHDVFTGSHPTVVFEGVMRTLGEIEAVADSVLTSARETVIAPVNDTDTDTATVTLFNGLPWARTGTCEIPLPFGGKGVERVTTADGQPLPFVVENNTVRIRAQTPATGYAAIHLTAGASGDAEWETVETATLENERVCVRFDAVRGLHELRYKPTGTNLWGVGASLLVAQRDDGNFQIENPAGAEVAAASGTMRLETRSSALGSTVRLSGTFPRLDWVGETGYLHWSAEFAWGDSGDALRLSLHLDWRGEQTRLRLMLPTAVDAASGIYEVPFGVVKRKPYSPRTNAKGEWPAHRFVAVEDDRHGVALVNTGCGGVEVSGGTIYSTLLRAPKSEYAGMVADATSSQHGAHDYSFDIIPYAGSWADAGVLKIAQEVNNPVHAETRLGTVPGAEAVSLLQLEPDTVVLSAIEAADGSGEIRIRVYETAGRDTEAVLIVSGALAQTERVWNTDLAGNRISDTEIPVEAGRVRFSLRPFEIRTLGGFTAPNVKSVGG